MKYIEMIFIIAIFVSNTFILGVNLTIPNFVYHQPSNPEKKLVIIITSYNNAQWYHYNLGSLFAQQYDNYRIIYIDDCSDDGTFELVEQFIKDRNQQHRCILIKNRNRKRALANFYYALQLCDDDEIVFNFDGDDWLAHDLVFEKINQLYQDPHLWITFGQFVNWPTGELGYCKALPDEYIQKQLFRQKWWMPGQLRTFYAWLCKQIQLKDLIFEGGKFNGEFFPANADLALYYPMMEMAGTHYKFIDEVIYIRNVETPLNDFKANKEIQIEGSKQLRAKKKYPKLEHSQEAFFAQFKQSSADIYYFNCSNLDNAKQFIDSCGLCNALGTIWIFYENGADQAEYLPLQSYKNVQAVSCKDCFTEQFQKCLERSKAEHILIASQGMIVTHPIAFNECIEKLERSFAYGLYLNLCPALFTKTPLNQLDQNTFAWSFKHDEDHRICYNFCQGALYRKSALESLLKNIKYASFADFYNYCKEKDILKDQIGICLNNAILRLV